MPPKLFISYSWSTPDYEQDILRIATELRDAGIDVILDKWDLREGHEATAFMEKMVADAHIEKVAIFCDKTYKDKADGRKGGVGTETQIISSEVYKAQDQNKFVAVVMERDDDGKACLPVYYSSRIYIDLSDPATYATQFERLLRWVYDKPLDVKPEIGKTPVFLMESTLSVRLATAVLARRAQDSIRNGRDNALPATREYFDTFVSELEKLRLVSGGRKDFDDDVVKSIEDFIPYRDEMIDLFNSLAMYKPGNDTYRMIHRLFESLIRYFDRPESIQQWTEWDFDNYRFIIHELYLYAIAIFLKHERFDAISVLTSALFAPSDRRNEEMLRIDRIREPTRSLFHRKERLQLRRISIRADMLKERCKGVPLQFTDLMQADFVLFLRAELHQDKYHGWFPETLLYAEDYRGAFEVFARARSTQYFENVKTILTIPDKDALMALAESYQNGKRRGISWDYTYVDPTALMGAGKIATQP
ncbi:TIR domain-containing protein [Agrobacterium burrii]